MNAKKAKTLRKMLRTNDIDPTERSYTAGPAGMRQVSDGLGIDGKPKVRLVAITGTITLKKNCGRHVYREAKRMAA